MCIALQVYSFNIGTNSFEFVFEDTSIPNNNKAQIISDFTDIITRCNLAEVTYYSPTNGVITYKKLHLEPYPSGDKIPKEFNHANGTNYLSISKIISDDLQIGLAIHNTYTNIYSKCTNFVNFLNSDDLKNISSNEIKNVIYYKNASEEIYQLQRDSFVDAIDSSLFYNPPKSSIYIMESDFYGITQESFWTFIPSRNGSSHLQGYIAVFFNNYWHLISPYDPVLEEFLKKAKERAQNSSVLKN